MGPRDHPSPLPDGARCTACGAPVPAGRIRLLASRDGLAFVRLVCDDCGTAAIRLLLDGSDDESVLELADPITFADVDAVRRDLAAWDGDLVGWLAR